MKILLNQDFHQLYTWISVSIYGFEIESFDEKEVASREDFQPKKVET